MQVRYHHQVNLQLQMLTPLLSVLSPAGVSARLSILIYHRVLAVADELQPDIIDALHFDRACQWLKTWFKVLPLDEAVQRLRNGTLPSRSAAITFDDGYADNHDVAMPVLLKHALSATFFVATGYLDGGRMFNDSVAETIRRAQGAQLDLHDTVLGNLGTHDLRSIEARRAALHAILHTLRHFPVEQRTAFCEQLQHVAGVAQLPDDLMLRSDQVRHMHQAGMLMGAHTVRHPMLARLDAATARSELTQSRRSLQDLLGSPVTLFAYPNGRPNEDYSEQTVDLVRKAGFEAAFTTAWGAARRDSDAFQLPRFTPWERSKAGFGIRLAANLRRRREQVVAVSR